MDHLNRCCSGVNLLWRYSKQLSAGIGQHRTYPFATIEQRIMDRLIELCGMGVSAGQVVMNGILNP